MLNRLIPIAFAALFGVSAIAQAPAQAPAAAPGAVKAAAPAPASAKADPRDAIAKKIEGLKPDDVRMSAIPGLYEIARGSQIGYVSGDARYAILGDLIDLDADANLSENRRRTIRNRLIDTVPESEMVVYGAKTAPYTLTIFTDIDCGYCRKMHSQMAEYNRLGIRVRYLFFPRSGPNTESWQKAESVWCATNRNDALTRAKNGETVKSSKCPTSIVARDFELGQKLGVDGTPAIFLPTGELLPGYSPPSELVHYLKTGKMP
ncbi:MAG: DsbC family protein [Steroidobacteraceae bacterium]|nr:DsbC family protein [Steroidobacteraceae bacterium]